MKPAGNPDARRTADLQGPDRAALPYWQPVLAVLSGLLILALGTALPDRQARETPAARVAAPNPEAAPVSPERRVFTEPELRAWTDRAGRQVSARLISATPNTLTLATPEGEQRTFARNAFSPADLAFVDWRNPCNAAPRPLPSLGRTLPRFSWDPIRARCPCLSWLLNAAPCLRPRCRGIWNRTTHNRSGMGTLPRPPRCTGERFHAPGDKLFRPCRGSSLTCAFPGACAPG